MIKRIFLAAGLIYFYIKNIYIKFINKFIKNTWHIHTSMLLYNYKIDMWWDLSVKAIISMASDFGFKTEKEIENLEDLKEIQQNITII